MELRFSSIDEIREFMSQLKGTRRGKGEADEPAGTGAAPQPMMPPGGTPGFAPAAQGFPAAHTGFPGAGAPTVAPEVAALVARINAKIDGAIASGQPTDAVLTWFRQRCGAEAAAATLDQIKNQFLAKQSVPHLEETAKLMGG